MWAEDEDEEPEDEDTDEVWHENEPAVRLFACCLTQWRMGSAGPVGLDYAVVPGVARDIAGIRRRELRGLWWQLQIMEGAVLEWFAEQRDAESK